MKHCVNRTETDKRPETCSLNNNAFYDFLKGKAEHHGLELYIIIHAAVTRDEFSLANVMHFRNTDKDTYLLVYAALELFLQDIEDDFLEFFAQPLWGDPYLVLKHQLMIHIP